MAPYLAFQSRNLEQTIDFLYGKDLRFDVASRHVRALDVRINGVYLPAGLYVGLTEYGARASVEATPRRDDYWLLIPVRGRMQTAVRGDEYVSDPRYAFLFSYPSMGPSRISVEANASRIMVVLTYASLRRQLAALLGRSLDSVPHPPLEFAPIVDLASGCGRSISRITRQVLTDCRCGGPISRSPVAMSSFEEFVLNELLLCHRHNYSDAIHGRETLVGSGPIKRAIDYMEAHLESVVTLADVVAAAGVPGRTLLKHFERYRGTSPMRYLRDARLERVRQILRQDGAAETVSAVAMSLGFGHMGRFSADYRKRFGERPSETVGRRKR